MSSGLFDGIPDENGDTESTAFLDSHFRGNDDFYMGVGLVKGAGYAYYARNGGTD